MGKGTSSLGEQPGKRKAQHSTGAAGAVPRVWRKRARLTFEVRLESEGRWRGRSWQTRWKLKGVAV